MLKKDLYNKEIEEVQPGLVLSGIAAATIFGIPFIEVVLDDACFIKE